MRGGGASTTTATETVGLPQLSPRTPKASKANPLQKTSDRPGTPRMGSGSALGAAGGHDENF